MVYGIKLQPPLLALLPLVLLLLVVLILVVLILVVLILVVRRSAGGKNRPAVHGSHGIQTQQEDIPEPTRTRNEGGGTIRKRTIRSGSSAGGIRLQETDRPIGRF